MGNSRALEIVIVLFILAIAVVFQFFSPSHKGETQSVQRDSTSPAQSKVDNVPLPNHSVKAGNGEEKTPSDYPGVQLPKFDYYLSSLGEKPNWNELNVYQRSITKKEFLYLLETIYTVSDSWKKSIKILADRAEIRVSTGNKSEGTYKLFFKTKNDRPAQKEARYWRVASELETLRESEKHVPLKNLVIAIDPGHIGGDEWAEIEERDFALAGDNPIREGEITLKVARMLKPELEKLGAVVVLVRDSLAPLNPIRPLDYRERAVKELKRRGSIVSELAVEEMSAKLFYRSGEILERAKIVNTVVKPDVVLCLHFNATFWGEGEERILADTTHFHLLLHGAYTDYEVSLDDERFSMIKKILMGNYKEELAIAKSVANSTAKQTGLPAFGYEKNSKRAINVDNNPYLWARNLLANRAYDGPVIYMEPYVMNSKIDYQRIQLGDYEGQKLVGGKKRISIFKEYTHSMVQGLKNYYSTVRAPKALKKEGRPTHHNVQPPTPK